MIVVFLLVFVVVVVINIHESKFVRKREEKNIYKKFIYFIGIEINFSIKKLVFFLSLSLSLPYKRKIRAIRKKKRRKLHKYAQTH